MSTSKSKATSPEIKMEPTETVQKTAPQTSTYTIKELIAAHKAFNAPQEIVAVALKLSGKETATEAEAKKIIEEFKNQEVK